MKIKKLTMAVAVLLLMLGSTIASAATVASGTCGDNATWTLDDEGTLIIGGTGVVSEYVFSDEYNEDIVNVIIEDGITSIGAILSDDGVINGWTEIFCFCYNMVSIELPDSLTHIGDYAFSDCYKLENVTLPKNLQSIGEGAFQVCESLESINIPSTVTHIGECAFVSCLNLVNIEVEEANQHYSSENGILFDREKTTLISYPAAKTDTIYTIPNSVKTIEAYAFGWNSSLTTIAIQDNVENVYGAFNTCRSLTDITVDNDNIYFVSENGVLFNKAKTKLVAYPAGKTGTTYTIPNRVTTIGSYAFASSYNITEMLIPNSVTVIDHAAFRSCKNLVNITIPDGLTELSDSVFSGCSSLKNVTLPKALTAIDNYTFERCNSLESITIPCTVTSIESYAFDYCNNLTDVYFNGTEAEWNRIFIGRKNESLISADKYYLKNEPTITQLSASKSGKYTLIEFMTHNLPDAKAVFIAAYNDNNFLKMKLVVPNETGVVQESIESNGETVIKAFVWDSLSSLVPLCQSQTYSLE